MPRARGRGARGHGSRGAPRATGASRSRARAPRERRRRKGLLRTCGSDGAARSMTQLSPKYAAAQTTIMPQDANHLIWIDMEMSGLDPDSDRILEVALVVTDSALNTVAEGPVLVVH